MQCRRCAKSLVPPFCSGCDHIETHEECLKVTVSTMRRTAHLVPKGEYETPEFLFKFLRLTKKDETNGFVKQESESARWNSSTCARRWSVVVERVLNAIL